MIPNSAAVTPWLRAHWGHDGVSNSGLLRALLQRVAAEGPDFRAELARMADAAVAYATDHRTTPDDMGVLVAALIAGVELQPVTIARLREGSFNLSGIALHGGAHAVVTYAMTIWKQADRDHAELVAAFRQLARLDVDLNEPSRSERRTPLLRCIEWNAWRMATALVQAGADPQFAASGNRSPASVVRELIKVRTGSDLMELAAIIQARQARDVVAATLAQSTEVGAAP